MKTTHSFLFASLFAAGCINAGIRPADPEVIEYRANSNNLQDVEEDADAQGGAGTSDQEVWNELRSNVQSRLENELGADFGIPVAVLEKINEIDLEIQNNNTITANFEVNVGNQGLDVAATIQPNVETGLLEDTFFVEGIKRFTVQHDLFSSRANAQVFNADEEPVFTADFTRDNDDVNLLFTNLNNLNTFLLNANREALFIGREENHNGEVDQNLEFRATVNTDELVGQVQIRFIFNFKVCFGPSDEGQLGRIDCDLVEDQIPAIDPGAF